VFLQQTSYDVQKPSRVLRTGLPFDYAPLNPVHFHCLTSTETVVRERQDGNRGAASHACSVEGAGDVCAGPGVGA
jgi:hypothetical protein